MSLPVLILARPFVSVRTVDRTGLFWGTLAKRNTKEIVSTGAAAAERRRISMGERVYVPVAEDEPLERESGTGIEEGAEKPSKPSMRDVFGPGGLLERCMMGGYEHRAAQLEMAERVHDAFESKHHVVVEAGTGTGETLGYLRPALCSGRRVVISTATKSLQEQLDQQDIPFLPRHLAPEVKVAVMKGRSNFLCRAKLHQMAGQPVL